MYDPVLSVGLDGLTSSLINVHSWLKSQEHILYYYFCCPEYESRYCSNYIMRSSQSASNTFLQKYRF